ncbi:MAG: hypothetical protein JXB13_07635 [Phycisphaerae bacterium]|nr:hypothetical protein [Phycisphaerae bacterium]
MIQSKHAPLTEEEIRLASETVDPREVELYRLRKALADAWWNEEPLEQIESIESQINACLAKMNAVF